MSAVNEWIVREYFESLGFFVGQPRKYVVPGRTKTADEEIDLVVYHPARQEHRIPDDMVWTTEHLGSVKQVLVAVRGWHTERFYASTFEQAPDILRFAGEETEAYAGALLGSRDFAKVLCLPRLPASGDLRDQTIAMLRSHGIQGVISFRTMIAELIERVDVNRNYEKSDLLQVIRLLKNYDFVKTMQLDFFEKPVRH
jgi:hypothetical protein